MEVLLMMVLSDSLEEKSNDIMSNGSAQRATYSR